MSSATAAQKHRQLIELENVRILLIEAKAHTRDAGDPDSSRRLELLLRSALKEVDNQIQKLRSS